MAWDFWRETRTLYRRAPLLSSARVVENPLESTQVLATGWQGPAHSHETVISSVVDYPSRRTCIGSTNAARLAGTSDASVATAMTIATIVTKTKGSAAETP